MRKKIIDLEKHRLRHKRRCQIAQCRICTVSLAPADTSTNEEVQVDRTPHRRQIQEREPV